MNWNIAPECVSTIVLCIIWVYSRKGNPIPTLKNRVFQACFLVTFCAMTSNILSTYLIFTLQPITLIPAWVVTMFYFTMTPMMGMVYFFYALANIFENERQCARLFLITSIPGAIYILLVLINPFTKDLFELTLAHGYRQGPFIMTTYLIFYLYCLGCVLLVLIKGKLVQPAIRAILFTFPIIAAGVIIIQMCVPNIILSGSAATSALLMIYLFLQNKQISIDHLTRLPNRQEFLAMLELKTKRDIPFAIVVLSLRDFKLINDTHGQHKGDALLVAVSDYLKREFALREGQLYRYSGDEFAILPHDTKAETIRHLVDAISLRMAQPWQVKDCTCMLSGVMGVVSYPESAQQVEGLINGIESAVTIAKADPTLHGLCYCNAGILEKAKRRQTILAILKDCLAQDGFQVQYQPIYRVDQKAFTMAEALLRIPDTPLGQLFPNEFIPIAEESGLIIDITYWMLERVCADMKRLLEDGFYLDGISVNFSTLQFSQIDLVPRIVEIVTRYHVPFSKLKIEITESTLADNVEAIRDFAHQMQDKGIRIGLDDFGTGYSNLTSVVNMPIDTVKLDKSLVWSAMKNQRFAVCVQNITNAFCELGMIALAEGVETAEQSQFVIGCGCSLIQGFYYAKPLPLSGFQEHLRRSGDEKPA